MQTVFVGDCVETMAKLPPESFDVIVCDPPYEIGFMGKKWDRSGVAFDSATWAAAFRVLKPGGYLLAFGGTRTYHRIACAIEDAGFDIRDSLTWMYGQGFPKSLNVGKAVEGREGWGTALKPASEPIVVARKPLIGTVAANVLKYGTGALNIDGCRVGFQSDMDKASAVPQGKATAKVGALAGGTQNARDRAEFEVKQGTGRWPPNVLLTHAPGCRLIGSQTVRGDGRGPDALGGVRPGGFADVGAEKGSAKPNAAVYGDSTIPVFACAPGCPVAALDAQVGGEGTSRFFPGLDLGEDDFNGNGVPFLYCGKTTRKEREAGCDDLPMATLARSDGAQAAERDGAEEYTGGSQGIGLNHVAKVRNNHPTVKPVALMRWLVRLVTPPGGIVLDPFAGSGTTGIACVREGFRFLGIERDASYAKIARARIAHAKT